MSNDSPVQFKDAQSWRNSAVFATGYVSMSIILTLLGTVIGLITDLKFPKVGLGDIVWKFAIDLFTPFTNILMVIFTPSAWWLGLPLLSFFLPVAADGNARARMPGGVRRAVRSESILAITGIALNTAAALWIVLTSIRPDLSFNEQIYPIASAASSAVAASLAFAVLLVAKRHEKRDKL